MFGAERKRLHHLVKSTPLYKFCMENVTKVKEVGLVDDKTCSYFIITVINDVTFVVN